MFVHPVVQRPGDDLLGVIAELVEHRDVGIAGQLGALGADLLVGPQVLDRKRVVGHVRVRPQQHAAVGVERDRAGDVADAHVMKLTAACTSGSEAGKRPGAVLLVLLAPAGREVAVQIELLLARLQLERHAVVVLDAPLGQQAIVASAGLASGPCAPAGEDRARIPSRGRSGRRSASSARARRRRCLRAPVRRSVPRRTDRDGCWSGSAAAHPPAPTRPRPGSGAGRRRTRGYPGSA